MTTCVRHRCRAAHLLTTKPHKRLVLDALHSCPQADRDARQVNLLRLQASGARYQQSPSQKVPWESNQPCWEVQHIGLDSLLRPGLFGGVSRCEHGQKRL